MTKKLGLFPISLMGSMPRTKEFLKEKRRKNNGEISVDEFNKLLEIETKKIVELQEKYDIDIITNGEQSRDNYVSFISSKINGAMLMNMADMLEYIEDKKSFEQILEILDVPAMSIKNAICYDKLEYRDSLVYEEMKELKNMTNRCIKATLPGPYLMTRSMWLPALSKKKYRNKEELGKDVVQILKTEIDKLEENGVDIVQFDEPVLTEVVFSEGKTRSFMCAALSEKKDPKEELEFAGDLIKEIMDYLKNKNIKSVLHVCRGNWSKDETTLLTGPYTPLESLFEKIEADILMLEFSTPRAGELSSLLKNKKIFGKTILGLGVVNPRSDYVESSETIIKRVEEALQYIPKEQIWLNPDCGFATFENRPVSTFGIIERKLEELNKAKIYLRGKYE